MNSWSRLARPLALLLLVACSPGAEEGHDGLEVLARSEEPTGAPHLTELLVHAGHAYVGNTTEGFAAFALAPELPIAFYGPPPRGRPSCTSLAIHPASQRLYCGSLHSLFTPEPPEALKPTIGTDRGLLAAFDLSDPAAPVMLPALAAQRPTLSVRDMVVLGDVLYVAEGHGGLLRADIAADGTLSELTAVDNAATARLVATDGAALVVADGVGRVTRLDPADPSQPTLGTVDLAAPVTGLRVHEGVVIVSLGSNGLATLSLDDGLTEDLRVPVAGVVTAADRLGDTLIAATTAGVLAWRLDDGAPRTVGYLPAVRITLDVWLVSENEALVSDWTTLARVQLDPAGQVQTLDISRGLWLQAGAVARVPMRNVGDDTLEVRATAGGKRLGKLRLGPGELGVVEVDPSAATGEVYVGAPVARVELEVRVPGDRAVIYQDTHVMWAPTTHETLLETRAVGQQLVPLHAVGPDGRTWVLPDASEKDVVWYDVDCPAMWAQLEDLAWRRDQGLLERDIVLLSMWSPVEGGFADAWGSGLAERMRWTAGPEVPPEVETANAPLGDPIYDTAYGNILLRGGAAYPTDYTIDEVGLIQAVRKVYRGASAFPLQGP